MTERSITTSSKNRIIKWLPGLIISLAAIIFLSRMADWQQVGSAIQRIPPIYILITAFSTVVFILVRALAWRVLLEEKASLKDTFFGISIGYLVNNLLPLRAGEFSRAIIIGKTTGLGAFHVLSTIVIERAFDLGFAAVLTLITLPLALKMDWARPVAITTLILVVIGVTILFLAARYAALVTKWFNQLGSKWSWFEKFLLPKALSLLEGLRVLVSPKRFFLTIFWIGTSWLIGVFVYYIVLLAFEPAAPLWWGAFADAVLAMGIAIPAAPASIGVFEAALIGALTILGIDYSSALAYAIVMHAIQLLMTGILGFIGLSILGTSLFFFISSNKVQDDE